MNYEEQFNQRVSTVKSQSQSPTVEQWATNGQETTPKQNQSRDTTVKRVRGRYCAIVDLDWIQHNLPSRLVLSLAFCIVEVKIHKARPAFSP